MFLKTKTRVDKFVKLLQKSVCAVIKAFHDSHDSVRSLQGTHRALFCFDLLQQRHAGTVSFAQHVLHLRVGARLEHELGHALALARPRPTDLGAGVAGLKVP